MGTWKQITKTEEEEQVSRGKWYIPSWHVEFEKSLTHWVKRATRQLKDNSGTPGKCRVKLLSYCTCLKPKGKKNKNKTRQVNSHSGLLCLFVFWEEKRVACLCVLFLSSSCSWDLLRKTGCSLFVQVILVLQQANRIRDDPSSKENTWP